MLYIEVKNLEWVVMYSNINQCINIDLFKKNKNIKFDENLIKSKEIFDEISQLNVWLITENDIDYFKSDRIFKRSMLMYASIVNNLSIRYKKNIELNANIIKTIQLKMSKEISKFSKQKYFVSSCYQVLIEKIKNKISDDLWCATNLIIWINNYIKELGIKVDENDYLVYWKIEEEDILDKKIINKSKELYHTVSKEMYNDYIRKIDVNSHTIKTIQAQMAQEIDFFINQELFFQKNTEQIQLYIKQALVKNPEDGAKLISQLRNRIKEITFHLESLELLYSNKENEYIKITTANLKKILLKMYSPFQNTFKDNNCSLYFHFDEEYTIKMNYELLNLVMHHFFHNAEKYMKIWSNIHFNIKVETKTFLIIEMASLEIKNKDKIFEEGYSWENVDLLAWQWIGMHVIKKWLEKMWMDIFIRDEKTSNENDTVYKKNIFSISLRWD